MAAAEAAVDAAAAEAGADAADADAAGVDVDLGAMETVSVTVPS